MPRLSALALVPLAIAGCAINDSHVAHDAAATLLGLQQVDLQSCLGAPDQHSTFGTTDVLTYYATSTSNINYGIPLVGGMSLTNGGYCHATFQVKKGSVTQILYSGEKNAMLAPDSYCAPIVRTCLDHLHALPPASR